MVPNQDPNTKLICLVFKETDNYLLKLTEDELAERFRNTLNDNKIKIDKFVDINTESLFEFYSSNSENLNKEKYMESIFPGDSIEFIMKIIF